MMAVHKANQLPEFLKPLGNVVALIEPADEPEYDENFNRAAANGDIKQYPIAVTNVREQLEKDHATT